MMTDIDAIVGGLFLLLICGWAVFHLCGVLRSTIESGKAADLTLSEVDKDDSPGIYGLQVLGLILLIICSVLIGVGAIVWIFS